jgi:hypothetical protein
VLHAVRRPWPVPTATRSRSDTSGAATTTTSEILVHSIHDRLLAIVLSTLVPLTRPLVEDDGIAFTCAAFEKRLTDENRVTLVHIHLL